MNTVETLKQPYLVQRAEFKKEIDPDKKGIDAILRFDYMGSSEFEWGALPAGLKRIRENLEDYTYSDYTFLNHPDKTVTVFCHKGHADQLPAILELLAHKDRPLRLKERCDLRDWVRPEECFRPYNRNDHWWDIDNDWMCWKSDPEFTALFKEKIKP